jgi:hypothetical protein
MSYRLIIRKGAEFDLDEAYRWYGSRDPSEWQCRV